MAMTRRRRIVSARAETHGGATGRGGSRRTVAAPWGVPTTSAFASGRKKRTGNAQIEPFRLCFKPDLDPGVLVALATRQASCVCAITGGW